MKKCLFAADLHGIEPAYDMLFETAKARGIDTVIIGGDICPKRMAISVPFTEPKESDCEGETPWRRIIFPEETLEMDENTGTYTKALEKILETNERLGAEDIESELRKNGYIVFSDSREGYYFSFDTMLEDNRMIDRLVGLFSAGISERKMNRFKLSRGDWITLDAIIDRVMGVEESYNVVTRERMAKEWNDMLGEPSYPRYSFEELAVSTNLVRYLEFRNRIGAAEKRCKKLMASVEGKDKISSYFRKEIEKAFRRIKLAVRMGGIYDSEMFRLLGRQTTPSEIKKKIGDEDYIRGQKDFVEGFFRKSIVKFKQDVPGAEVYLILGNDDRAEIEDNVIQLHNIGLINYLNKGAVPLGAGLFIAGYPYVKESGEYYPGWEKSEEGIENDLKDLAEKSDPKKTIYVCHSPPFGSQLDITYVYDKMRKVSFEKNIGSSALRDFIAERKPLCVLSGHVHDSYKNSGKVADKINDTTCYNPGGNHNLGEFRAVIVGIENPADYELIAGRLEGVGEKDEA